MSKINIAICLSAEPRYWEIAAQSIFKFIQAHQEQCEVHVFYHFWDNITKRQSHLIDDPVIETVDKDKLQKYFKPTVGVCESKSGLDPHLQVAWEYIETLKAEYNMKTESLREGLDKKELFYQMVKTTNCPPFSQMISMCKSFTYMTDYAEKNNIYYDIVIRTRSDVEILPVSIGKIQSVVNKDKLSRYIQFPSIAVRTPGNNDPTLADATGEPHVYHTPFAEYCFFVSSLKILNKSIFNNYTEKLVKLLFRIKNRKFPDKVGVTYLSSHNCVPLFLKQHKSTQIGAPIGAFKFKLKQMEIAGDIHGR